MIRDLIIKTPYNPGERLPPEREIAEMLDVTRTVVREALIMLQRSGKGHCPFPSSLFRATPLWQ